MSMITDALHDYNLRYFHNIDPPTFTATYDGSVGTADYTYVATYVTINGETIASDEVTVEDCDVISENDTITLVAQHIPAAARTIKYFRKNGDDYFYIGTSTVAVNALVDNGLSETSAEPPTTNTSGRSDYHFIGYKTDRPLQRMELIDHQAIVHDWVKKIGDTTFENGDIISGLALHIVDAENYQVSVDAGSIYFDGVVIQVPASGTITLQGPPESGVRIEKLGVLIESTIVSYEDDPKLRNLDDNIPIEYYNLPGADRVSTSVTWALDDPAALAIHTFENGIQMIRPLPLERTVLMRAIAARTKDITGDCVTHNFQAKTLPNVEDATKFNITFGPGVAYVDGYKVDIPTSRSISIDKARDYASQSGSKALDYNTSGGYFVSGDGPFAVNGKNLKFKFGSGKSITVSFSGTLTAAQITTEINSAIPWFCDSSIICEPLGELPEGTDDRQFMLSAPRGKELIVESVADDCYSILGISAATYKPSGRRIYQLREQNIKSVSDVTGFCVEAITSVVRGSGTSDFLDADLNDVIGVNVYGATADEKQQLLNDNFYTINTAGTVGELFTVDVASGGTGYQALNELNVLGGYGGVVVVSSVDGNGAVTAVSVKSGNEGYGYSETIVPTSGGSGTGCYVSITAISAAAIAADNTNIVFSGTGYPAQGTTYYVKYTKYVTPTEGQRTKVRITNGKVQKGAADGVDIISLVADQTTTATVVSTGASTTVPTGNIRDIITMTSINSAVNTSGVEYTAARFNSGITSISLTPSSIDWSACSENPTLPGGQPDTSSYYYVSFDYFRHDVEGDYLVATSYDDYDSITLAPNKSWNLRDCFDLRPDGQKPIHGCDVFVDYDYYLARMDKLVVTNDGTFKIIEGQPAERPAPPRDTPGNLSLYLIRIPAYTYSASDVALISTEPLRITQQGIREVVKRLDKLEYAFASSALTNSSADTDTTLNSVGMFVDSCIDETKVNKAFQKNGVNHDVAFDKANQCFRLPTEDVSMATLVWDSDESSHFRLVQTEDGSIICLDYTPVIVSYQPMATDTININPNPIVNYINGNLRLTPSSDMYFDTTQLPNRVTEIDASIDEVLRQLAPYNMNTTTWGTWHYTGSNEAAPPPGSIDSITGRITGTLYSQQMTREEFFELRRLGIPANIIPTLANSLMNVGGDYAAWRQRMIDSYAQQYNPWPQTFTPEAYRDYRNNPYTNLEMDNFGNVTGYGSVYYGPMPAYVYNSNTGFFMVVPPIEYDIEIEWNAYVAEVTRFYSTLTGRGWSGHYDNTTEVGISRDGSRSYISTDRQEIDLGTNVVDISAVPMMRTHDNDGNAFRIDVSGHSLMPNTAHACTIGSKPVDFRPGQGYSAGTLYQNTYATVVTDADGAISGYFYMPTGIPSGTAEVCVFHRLGAQYSSGRVLFTSRGLTKTVQETTIGVTVPVVRTESLSDSGVVYDICVGSNYVDPIAQTFEITAPTYITAVGVYFATKNSGNIPVTCDIRKVVNGYVTREVLASSSLFPSQITTSSDGSVETVFTFPQIRMFDANEYAIVLVTACQDYNVFIATSGLPDLITEVPYNLQRHGGVLFRSMNNSTWTPIEVSDMKFRIYRANFEPEGELVFQGVTGVEAGILSAQISQILVGGVSSAWYYKLSTNGAWIPFDPIIDQELSAYPDMVYLKVIVKSSGGSFQVVKDGTGIVLKNHKSTANYISKTFQFEDVLAQPDEVAVTLSALTDGLTWEYTGGTTVAVWYSTDTGDTWCEILPDPSFSPKVINHPFVDYRFVTAAETSIDSISGTNGQPLLVTSMGHRFTDNQLVYIDSNTEVSSSILCMVDDRTSDTFKLRNASTGAYLNSSGATVTGGTITLAPISEVTLCISPRTPILAGTTSTRPRTPMFKNVRCVCNANQ